ncbi:MAG: NAD-dependent epimerase/dehydratase family protein, partial [Cyanobacteriota bacterium]|nr:NAD-dependent epimerase/dehydratase family protein [Cyanobacteriota bacterium]
MKVFVLGGDGFCGWPCAVNLADRGHDVLIVDNLSRRKIDIDLEVESLTPITSIGDRLRAWQEIGGKPIRFEHLDIAHQYDRLVTMLKTERPDAVVHFAEQRAAPYSMKSSSTKRYTVDNNVNGTHNLLAAIVESGLDTHIVHLGTMGVYGYGSHRGATIPEGYLK